MFLKSFINFMYLGLALTSFQVLADCSLNRYGQELCVGDQALYVVQDENKNSDYKLVEIKNINYNVFTVKQKNIQIAASGDELIAKRNCNKYKSDFCVQADVEVKDECLETKKSFELKQLFYNDLVLVKQKGLFSNKTEIVKTECIKI